MMSSRAGPGAGARRSLLMLPLLGPGRRICGGICRSFCCSRRAAAYACRCCRSRARSTGRTCTCAVGRHGMFPGGRLRMMIVMTRRMIIIATAARVRVVVMGSAYSTAGRCICVREAAPAGAAVVIVRIRRGRSGTVSGQRTRRCHRSRRGGQGGHLSMIWAVLGWPVGRRARDLPVGSSLFVMPKAKPKAKSKS